MTKDEEVALNARYGLAAPAAEDVESERQALELKYHHLSQPSAGPPARPVLTVIDGGKPNQPSKV